MPGPNGVNFTIELLKYVRRSIMLG